MVKKKNIKPKKPEKYVHEGFAWNLTGPIDEKSKAFVLAAYGGDKSEAYRKLREQEGGEPDWEDLAINIALCHELARPPIKRSK